MDKNLSKLRDSMTLIKCDKGVLKKFAGKKNNSVDARAKAWLARDDSFITRAEATAGDIPENTIQWLEKHINEGYSLIREGTGYASRINEAIDEMMEQYSGMGGKKNWD